MSKYTLVGVDGNAHAIIAYVVKAMEEQGSSPRNIEGYIEDAKSSDYEHLLSVSIDKVEAMNALVDLRSAKESISIRDKQTVLDWLKAQRPKHAEQVEGESRYWKLIFIDSSIERLEHDIQGFHAANGLYKLIPCNECGKSIPDTVEEGTVFATGSDNAYCLECAEENLLQCDCCGLPTETDYTADAGVVSCEDCAEGI